MTPWVLASGSALRRRLLADAGFVFEVDAADIDESPREQESPASRASRLAADKALSVSRRRPGLWVLGADQVGVTDEGVELAKCWDEDAAREQLRAMQGRAHTFFSAAALARDGVLAWQGLASARVRFRALSDAELRAYVALGEWRGCAGSYQLEGRGIQLVEAIEGLESTVWGLPLLEVVCALRAQGLA